MAFACPICCPVCGATFPFKQLQEAINNRQSMIQCRYCGTASNFDQMRSSHIATGYESLSIAKFADAAAHFMIAIDQAQTSGKRPSPDALLGAALAEMHVQTIISEESIESDFPELICHTYEDGSFSANAYFRQALSYYDERGIVQRAGAGEKSKLLRYAKTINEIWDEYSDIQESSKGREYGAFIAYEDNHHLQDRDEGFDVALQVKGQLDDEVAQKVFLPDIDNYGTARYEAEILYAIDHCKCMVVIADNDINYRLNNIYTRFFNRDRANNLKKIVFICYQEKRGKDVDGNAVPSENIFQFEKDAMEYTALIRFLLTGKVIKSIFTVTYPDEMGREKKLKVQYGKPYFIATHPVRKGFRFIGFYDDPVGGECFVSEDGRSVGNYMLRRDIALYPRFVEYGADKAQSASRATPMRLPDGRVSFGSYPQKLVRGAGIEEFCGQFALPGRNDPAGWQPLYFTKKKIPYTWIRDEMFHGKKYRLVYFIKPRDLYTLQTSDSDWKLQYKQNFSSHKIYCFEFEPIVWETVTEGNYTVLTAAHALDSMPFNGEEMNSDWELSTLNRWLNQEFLEAAFDGEQQEALLYNERDERVGLASEKSAWLPQTENRMRVVSGTDYLRCIGGMCDNYDADCYWVETPAQMLRGEARVAKPHLGGFDDMPTDSTYVAVVPSVTVNM